MRVRCRLGTAARTCAQARGVRHELEAHWGSAPCTRGSLGIRCGQCGPWRMHPPQGKAPIARCSQEKQAQPTHVCIHSAVTPRRPNRHHAKLLLLRRRLHALRSSVARTAADGQDAAPGRCRSSCARHVRCGQRASTACCCIHRGGHGRQWLVLLLVLLVLLHQLCLHRRRQLLLLLLRQNSSLHACTAGRHASRRSDAGGAGPSSGVQRGEDGVHIDACAGRRAGSEHAQPGQQGNTLGVGNGRQLNGPRGGACAGPAGWQAIRRRKSSGSRAHRALLGSSRGPAGSAASVAAGCAAAPASGWLQGR